MAIIIIRESDLDDKTIKVVGGKVAAPGAEIEILDKYPDAQDTDTHYATTEHKYLRHVETGAIWTAAIVKMKERQAPQQEYFLGTPTAEVNKAANNFTIKATSAIDGHQYGEVVGAFNRADYTDAKDFNEKHAGQKLSFTTPERFSTVGDRGKILPTTVEVDYPQLPFTEGTSLATLSASYGDPDLTINYDDASVGNEAFGITKTVHYKITMYSGKVFEGTKTFTGNGVTADTLAYDIYYDKQQVSKVEYAVDPFQVSYFFGNVTVAPEAITRVIGDFL